MLKSNYDFSDEAKSKRHLALPYMVPTSRTYYGLGILPLDHHFDVATRGGGDLDEPIQSPLGVLSYAFGPVIVEGIGASNCQLTALLCLWYLY